VGGAAVTVLTKSGTNKFHGSAFGLHDNSALRAWLVPAQVWSSAFRLH